MPMGQNVSPKKDGGAELEEAFESSQTENPVGCSETLERTYDDCER